MLHIIIFNEIDECNDYLKLMLHFEELNRCGENWGMDVVTEPPVDEIVGETLKKTRMGYAPIKKEYLIEGKTTIDPSSADDSDVVGSECLDSSLKKRYPSIIT